MNSVIICSATRKPFVDFFDQTPLGKYVRRSNSVFNIKENNSNGLPKCYNEFIKTHTDWANDPKHGDEYDPILLFVHDDVEIQDDCLEAKLNEGLKEFDVIGLAGTQIFNMKKPILWHVNDRNKFSGAVAHSHEKKVWMTPFGEFKKRCIVIDGLFIATKLSTLVKNNLRFDELFSFHHYDIDFCLNAHNKGVSIGTWPIWVVHHSIGVWDKPEWHESERKFCEKYKIS